MSYYLFNRQEILEKAQKRYSKEKAAEFYLQNKEVIKEKARNRYKNLSEEEKNKIKEYQKKRYQELIQYKKEALKNKLINLSLCNIIMSEKILKKNFINLNKQLIQIQYIVKKVTNILLVIKKMKLPNQEDEIAKPLCIILPQINGYIKCFENGGKNMSLSIKNSEVWEKYEEI